MKRNIVMLMIFFLMLGGAVLAAEKMILKVKVQTANVRSEPDAAATIVSRVASGTLLDVAGKEGDWYEVTVNDPSGKAVSGYIHKTVVDVLEEKEAAQEEKPRAVSRRKHPGPGRPGRWPAAASS